MYCKMKEICFAKPLTLNITLPLGGPPAVAEATLKILVQGHRRIVVHKLGGQNMSLEDGKRAFMYSYAGGGGFQHIFRIKLLFCTLKDRSL